MTGRSIRKAVVVAAILLSATWAFSPPVAYAQSDTKNLPPRLLFAVSGGFWKGGTRLNTEAAAKPSGGSTDDSRGYYRIVAYRTEDNTSQIYLQRIVLEGTAPAVVETMPVDKINELDAYVTDIRQDNASGVSAAEGFSAFVALKRDPKAAEPVTWTVFVDEYGTVTVEKPTN